MLLIKTMEKEEILLHICCAVCGRLFTQLLSENYSPVIYYDNSNIYPEAEYMKRRDETRKLAEKFGLRFIDGRYDHEEWKSFVAGLEEEPEGGKRCDKCFLYRLQKAAGMAKQEGIARFTTTLSLSPFKNEIRVEEAGEAAKEMLEFLTPWKEFEKKDFWRDNMKIVRAEEIYRQNYCGCEFSMRK